VGSELVERLAAERDRLDRRIGDLVRARGRLDSVISGASSNMRTGAACASGLSE
jgi:hypothetical protein